MSSSTITLAPTDPTPGPAAVMLLTAALLRIERDGIAAEEARHEEAAGHLACFGRHLDAMQAIIDGPMTDIIDRV